MAAPWLRVSTAQVRSALRLLISPIAIGAGDRLRIKRNTKGREGTAVVRTRQEELTRG
jgi:hypothetical protein